MKRLLTQQEVNTILGVKNCTICYEPKQLTEFYKKKRNKDGHCSECKACNDAKRLERKIKKQNVINPIPTPITYPKSLVMETLDDENMGILELSIMIGTILLAGYGAYYYIAGALG